MPFNFSSPEFLSHHRTRKNRVSPVSRASPAHMNSLLVLYSPCKRTRNSFRAVKLIQQLTDNLNFNGFFAHTVKHALYL